MNARHFSYPSFTQRHPVSLMLLALAPIAVSLSLTTVVNAQSKVAASSAGTNTSDQAASEASESSSERTTAADADQPAKELSVAPLDVVEYPDDRPDWIDAVTRMDGDTHFQVAVSQPGDTWEESSASLELMQRIAVQLYANKLLLSEDQSEPFVLDSDWIAENVDRFVSRRYEGTLRRGDMELFEHAVELEFAADVQQEIRRQWKNAEVKNRLGALGFLVFVATVLTGCGSAALGIVSRRVEQKFKAAS
tara:strand:+ start:461932 stop:462681 length:750 start_codon:yes stop_codon:yes gene_type:complete